MNNTKKIKVLHILETLDCGGIETFITNIYENIDVDKVQFDFLTLSNKSSFFYEDKVKKLGGRVIRYKQYPTMFIKHLVNIALTIIKNGPYQAVHCHYTAFNGFALAIAKLCGVKVLISHAHIIYLQNGNILKRYYRELFRCFLKYSGVIRLACSIPAAEALYDKSDSYIINNGVDLNRFVFNNDIREKIRGQLKLEDKFILFHSGRLEKEKNQTFILDIFASLLKYKKESFLILAGEGSMKEELENKAKKLNIDKKILFLGAVSNLYEFLQAADFYIFPSKYEALGLALIEAQAAGLPCIVSEIIPKEALLVNTKVLCLKDSAETWAKAIASFDLQKRNDNRLIIESAGFDIRQSAKKLQNLYCTNKF